jgi:hypothetical protein
LEEAERREGFKGWLEVGGWKLEVGSWRLEVGGWKRLKVERGLKVGGVVGI